MDTRTLAGVMLAFAVAGCGRSDGSGPGPAPSGTPGPAATTTPTPVGSSPLDTTEAPGFPRAADGTNVRACRDGRCEILVNKRVTIPLDARFGFKAFSFDPADSTWRFTYANGGSGSVNFLEPPYSGEWAAPTGTQGLVLTVVASEGSRAVISLRPAD